MAVRSFRMGTLLAALALLPVVGFAAQAQVCNIGRIADLAVTMNGMRPMVDAKIDGKDARFFLDSRGLVYLRMGTFDKSIADYDAVLKLQPRNPWALYVRGVAKVRKGATADGENDIAASRAITPRAAADAERRGIVP
jgi:tetratricopeptide (TPR) repeat protein